jgi:hypothetical protein
MLSEQLAGATRPRRPLRVRDIKVMRIRQLRGAAFKLPSGCRIEIRLDVS